MAPPKGSQYALGHGFGRPKEWTEEAILQEAKDLIAWSECEDALVLRMFAGMRGYSDAVLRKLAAESDIFRTAYECAKTTIGARRELLALDKMIPRYAAYYDDGLEAFERSRLKYESDLRKAEASQASEASTKAMEALMNQISSLQSSRSTSHTIESAPTKSE